MDATESFSRDYHEARDKFRAAAAAAGGAIEAIGHPDIGPDGGGLSTDVALFGPRDAEKMLVLISGTHGVEGFCGSGAQVDLLRRGELAALPGGLGVLMVHAANPYGFAWLRRTNEDNVDLNRNWIDFDQPLPSNPGYEAIRDAVCPPEWNEASRAASDAAIAEVNRTGGPKAAQQAIAGGQYGNPAGLFFGGSAPSWSRRTQTALFVEYLAKSRAVGIIDYHTGLGPWGYGERIVTSRHGSAGFERAARWFGCAITSPAGGTSESTDVAGDGLSAAPKLLPEAEITAMALEYGTYPIPVTLTALQADAWLHAHGDVASPAGRQIKQAMRDAFYGDTPDWKGMVVGQSMQAYRQAVAGLTTAIR